MKNLFARLSLTTRLTLLFAAASTVVLLALGSLIGRSVEHHFEEQDRDALAGKLMLATQVIERVNSQEAYARLPDQLSDALVGHHDLVVKVLGLKREVLLASSGITFPVQWLDQVGTTPGRALFAWTHGERHYRGLAASIPTGMPDRPALVVAVAVDTDHHRAFMATFMQTLWWFVAGATVATGLLGRFAVSRGLAPLRAMRERATLVTAHRLDQRLPGDAVPAELADLAISLNEMLERLEEAFRRLSDFSSDLAHELRTPISNLMTQTQVSLSRARDADSYRGILESNAEEFERLARMISDMLFLAKADNGLTLANCGPVDLAREVRELFEFYEALAEEKGIGLRLVGEGTITGDRLMLRRALSNLLSNALRHTPPQGQVTVTLDLRVPSFLIHVENTGENIPTQQQARLFERFYRADPSRHHGAGDGTGLGLAITRAIVQAHQGEVEVSSELGRTRFSIRLPVG